uniref:Bm14283 n=1 Tax=Brugia malayi TaxID=6279 RepID=A0A1I9G4U7_BRUMA|nr:Bm14283 [Brugia malayi]
MPHRILHLKQTESERYIYRSNFCPGWKRFREGKDAPVFDTPVLL